MKTLLSFTITALLIFTSSCGQAQSNISEKEIKNMLLEFYLKHFSIWENTPISNAVPVNVHYQKLDSLMQIYCTSKVRSEAKEVFQNIGGDVLTNNLIGDSNKNLKVEKDAGKENGYVVSFLATYSNSPGGPITKRVVLHVIVVKEKDKYRIDHVN